MKQLSGILFLFVFFAFQSCSDEERTLSSQQENISLVKNATGNPYNGISIVGDLFVAETNNDFKNFLHYLERSESDETLRNATYNSLGLDPATRTSMDHYTGHPGAYKFEEDFLFTSKRRMEEDAIFHQLDKGEDVFSIISNPYLKTVMNQYDAFKVEDRIYRVLGAGHYAVIHNNDMATYNTVKTLPLEDITTAHNVSFVGLEDEIFDDANPNDVTNVLVQKVDVKYQKNNVDKYEITNQSVIEFEDHYPGYRWTYEDNTTSIGLVPDRDFEDGESVGLTIVKSPTPIFSGGPGDTFLDTIIITKRDSRCDWTTEQIVTVVKLTNNIAFFNFDQTFANPVDPANIYYTLEFPDENKPTFSTLKQQFVGFSGFPRLVKAIVCIHFPSEPGYPEEITCCREIEFWVGECEETSERKDERTVYLPNGVKVKIEGLIWVETSGAFDWATPGEVGARTKINIDGNSVPSLKATVALRGQYVDKEEQCAAYVADLFEWNIIDDQLAINYDHEDARKFPGQLESKHTIEYNGVSYTVPTGDDWLVLE